MTRAAIHSLLAGSLVLGAAACGAGGAGGPGAVELARTGASAPKTGESTPTMSSPAEYAARDISAEAGAAYFLETGGGDPYAAGLAYPIFLAMMEMFPEELGRDWNELAEKFGFIPDPGAKGDPKAPPIGFHLTIDPNTNVPWVVVNCQLCHADRLRLPTGDKIVAGLGSKRVRAHAYANAIVHIGSDPRLEAAEVTRVATARARAWGVPWPESVRRPIVDASVVAWKKLSAKRAAPVKKFDAGLPGRVATIESFSIALSALLDVPIPLPETTGWAKVPDVRGFPYRDTFSWDASGYGSPQALVLDADFVFGARAEWYLSHPHIATSTYLYLKSFSRKLPFPKPVDAALAARGKGLFEARCAKCHGYYVDHGDDVRVSYHERVIPKQAIGTDPARADAVTQAFVDAANAVPITKGHARVRSTGGYVPPVLIDVWARGLYGHAGQWPSLEVMATPPAERPKTFVVDTNGAYDLDRIGIKYEVVDAATAAARSKKPEPGKYVYDGNKAGYRVEGHPFLSELPAGDRRAVIEYLKTLSSG